MLTVNYLAVVISLVAYTVLGMLWYGPLFGKKWVRFSGMADKDMSSPEMKKAQIAGYVSSLISSFIAVLTLAAVMKGLGITDPINGLLLGAGLGFGLISATLVGEAAWHGTPWALVLINGAYRICGLGLAGLIIGLW